MLTHQTEVFNVAYRMLGNRQEAEDIVQETFLRAYRAFLHFDPDRPPGPWLKKIAFNLCLNRLERSTDLPLIDEELPVDQDPEHKPEALVETHDLSAWLRSELLRLPARYRAAIELRHFQLLSYAEMAEVLNCPVNQVKSDLFRARKLLVKNLQRKHFQ